MSKIKRNRLTVLTVMAYLLIGPWSTDRIAAEMETSLRGKAVNGLQVTLRIQGNTFQVREYIPLELELQNISNKPFSLYSELGPTPTPAGVTFYLRHGEDPEIVAYTGGKKTPFQHFQLKSESSRIYQLVLTMRHADEPSYFIDAEGIELQITKVLEPGDWELWLKVNYQKGAGEVRGISDIWEGDIFSNPVSFKVIDK